MHSAREKSARRQHHHARFKLHADLRDDACNFVAFKNQVIHRLLKHPQIRVVFEPRTHGFAIQHAVSLRASGAHCRAFARIENAELNARFVRHRRHRAAQRIHFFNEMAFADAADGRVTRHLPQRFDAVRQQQGVATHARGSKRGFAASVPATDNNYII